MFLFAHAPSLLLALLLLGGHVALELGLQCLHVHLNTVNNL